MNARRMSPISERRSGKLITGSVLDWAKPANRAQERGTDRAQPAVGRDGVAGSDRMDAASVSTSVPAPSPGSRELIQESLGPVVIVERNGCIVSANRATQMILGYGDDEALAGMQIVEMVHPESRAQLVELLGSLRENRGVGWETGMVFRSRHGDRWDARVQASRMQVDGADTNMLIARAAKKGSRLMRDSDPSESLEEMQCVVSQLALDVDDPLSALTRNAEFAAADLSALIGHVHELTDGLRAVSQDPAALRKLAMGLDMVTDEMKACRRGAWRVRAVLEDLQLSTPGSFKLDGTASEED
jgi:PAS domain S-box-containing protein